MKQSPQYYSFTSHYGRIITGEGKRMRLLDKFQLIFQNTDVQTDFRPYSGHLLTGVITELGQVPVFCPNSS
jgi:hypothetical protein